MRNTQNRISTAGSLRFDTIDIWGQIFFIMKGPSWVEWCLAVSLAPMHMMPVPLPELSQSKTSLGH